MKKLFFPLSVALFAAFFLLLSAPAPAGAADLKTQYAVVSDNEAYLYANREMGAEDRLCILPKTYYVRVETVYSDCYAVSYLDASEAYPPIFGYMEKQDLIAKEPIEQPWYFSLRLEPLGSPLLYTVSPDDDQHVAAISARQKIYYYGDLYDAEDNLFYYVAVAGRLGYVAATDVNAFTIPIHPDSVPPPSPSPSATANPSGGGGTDVSTQPGAKNDTLQIFLIIAICVPAIIIVFLLFKGSGKPPKSRYRDTYTRSNYPPYDKDNFDDGEGQ